MKKQQVSVILPIHNQSKHIGSIIDQYEEAFLKFPADYELLLVVNGSKDNSLEICIELSKKYKSIKVFECKKKGWGRAVRLGIKESKGDIICFTNSARTPAKDLMLFLVYSVIYPEVVIKANRKIRDSKARRLGSLLYNIECRVLFDLANWDINGTPKVFPRKFKELLDLERDDDLIDLEFNHICRRESYPMIEIPVFFYKRQGGKSTTNYRSAMAMYWGAVQLLNKTKSKNK